MMAPAAMAQVTPAAPVLSPPGINGRQVRLNWTPTRPFQALYRVEAGSAPGLSDLANLLQPGTEFLAGPVAPGTYYVRVREAEGPSPGPPSNEVVVVVAGCVGPSVPEITGGNSGQVVGIGWQDPSRTGCSVDFAIVEAGLAPGASDVGRFAVAVGRSVVFRDVPAGQYFVRVRFVHNGVESAPSNEVQLVSECTPPPPVSNLRAEPVGNAARFSWTLGLARPPQFDLRLEAGTAPGLTDVGAVVLPTDGGGSYNVMGMAGAFYTRVRATNACGSTVSNEVAVTLTSECLEPGPIPFINARDGAVGHWLLDWESAAGPGLATAYRISVGSAPGQADLMSLVVDGARSTEGPVGWPYQQWVPKGGASSAYVSVTPLNACGAGRRSFELFATSCSVRPGGLDVVIDGAQARLLLERVPFPEYANDVIVEVGRTLYGSDVLRQTARTDVQQPELTVTLPPGRYFARTRNVASCGVGAPSREVVFVIEP
jgi:hypothetical protein